MDRDDVYVTSKLSNNAHRPDDARRAFDESLKALGLDYLDLFLIHRLRAVRGRGRGHHRNGAGVT